MGKSSGGSVDTSGLEDATAEATALQRQIYEEGREDIQPWYNAGVGAVGKLSDLLGINGGSMLSREQAYDQLKDQYTTQSPINSLGGDGALYLDRDGEITTQSQHRQQMGNLSYARDNEVYQPAPQATTDYAGLNTAVDEMMANQGQTPEGFGSLLETFDSSKLQDDSGYQFRQEEANKALERQMAAQGVTMGGGGYGELDPQAYRAMQELNQGLASQEYQAGYNRYVSDQLNTFNMLMGASGSGQQAANQTAAAGQSYATNAGNLQTGLANAQYQAAQANASQPSMFSSLLGAGVQLGSAALMSDMRMKENIKYIGDENGHKMYEFNYIGKPERYSGVMAQDILEYAPNAVLDIGGVYHVNYNMLGVDMKEVV